MVYNLFDLVGDSKMATKRENKKKLHKLLDKYGSVEEIERSGDLRDGFELDFARIDGALEEVLEERWMGYVGGKEIPDSLKASGMTSVCDGRLSGMTGGVDTGYFAKQNSGMTERVKNSGMTV